MLNIRYGDFFVLRGILLSLSGDSIRVALEDCGDAAEYRRVDAAWVSEFGEPVKIELLPAPRNEPATFPLAAVESCLSQYCVV